MFWKRASGPFTDGEEVKIAGKVVARDLIEAPLSGKQVASWKASIKVPVQREGPLVVRAALYVVRDGIDAVRAAASRNHTIAGPIKIVDDHASKPFEIETKRGTLKIDAATLSGPPLVIIPRDLDREKALLDAWELTGTYPTGRSYPEPAFEEIVVEPGQTVDVSGVYKDGALTQAAIKTRR